MKKTKIYFSIAFLLIIFDQLTKIVVKGFNLFGFTHKGFYLGESIPVIGETITFTFVENPGAAFGLEFGAAKIFLSLFSVFAGAGLGWYLWKLEGYNKFVRIGIMFIFSGAVGNMIDRVFYGVIYSESSLFYGKVVDFIRVDIPNIEFLNMTHWPVFNIADFCVSSGVIILLFVHDKLPSIAKIRGIEKSED
ncbi:signal peptidase II [Candidatus Kapabacteria bacterium]|nr:signal peptidase II [Candidatus Kapabacteria bacterium]